MTHTLLDGAEQRAGPDFEDDLQIECAESAELDAIVTGDPAGFVNSPVVVVSPAELLAWLPKVNEA